MDERLVLCGEACKAKSANETALRLDLTGRNQNVTLKLEDISRKLVADIPPLLIDLLELATYVFCADQATSRGGRSMKAGGADWRRRFHFVVPVRQPDHWQQPKVREALESALSFASDDEYRFEFESLTKPPPLQRYLQFSDRDPAGFDAEEVALFSGGLDSFSGAVEELAEHRKKLALITHRSSPKVFKHQKRLVAELKRRFPQNVLHVPVLITKQGSLRSPESTQRSRSFLYGSLALIVAGLLGNSRIRFFENGVVSLNFPFAEHVVGSRATRTTHPLFISRLQNLFTELIGAPIKIDNPFIWKTKSEIIKSIVRNGCGDLIGDTVSCTRVYTMTALHTHCGACSQCIDRRFGIISAGAERFDPAERYGVDLLTGERTKPEDRTMAESYTRHALEIRRMDEQAFFSRFAGETARVLLCFPDLSSDDVGRRVLDLHKRHAEGVGRALEDAIAVHRSELIDRRLPPTCVLVMSVSRGAETKSLRKERYEDPSEKWMRDELAGGSVETGADVYEPLQLAIDPHINCVVVRNVIQLESADSMLIRELRGALQEDLSAERIPENHHYISPETLAKQLGGIEPATLRRRVSRCRKIVGTAYKKKMGRELPEGALIQNKPRTGYRLNPGVRFVSFGEIQPHYATSQVDAADVTTSPKRH